MPEVILTNDELDSYMRSGTADSYDSLNDRPQINGVTLSGNKTSADLGLAPSTIINTIYPVGAIYMSVSDVSPATLFGGTWEQITNTFLYASDKDISTGLPANPKYPVVDTNVTSTGGRKDLALVAHTHNSGTLNTNNNTADLQHTHGTNDGTHYILRDSNYGSQSRRQLNSNSSGSYYSWMSSNINGLLSQTVTGPSPTLKHNHAIVGATASTGTVTSGTNEDNMPPYMPVYMWKRTA